MSGDSVDSEPMDVDSAYLTDDDGSSETARENASAAKSYNPTAYENSLISENIPSANEGAATASAETQTKGRSSLQDLEPGSWACMQVEVEWPEEILENRREFEIKKAFQSLLNKLTINADFRFEDLKNDRFAMFSVKPPSVMKHLFKEKSLTFKSCNKTANVRFSPAPSAPPAPPEYTVADRQQNADAMVKSFGNGTFKQDEPNGTFFRSEQEAASWHNVMALSTSNETTAFSQIDAQAGKEIVTAPLFQYWHIATACSKEINIIKRNNRVNINAEAAVSITECKDGKESVQRAKNEFTSLFQMCAHDINIISVRITNLDQGNILEMLREIQREDLKLVLSVSSKGCQLSGPKDSLDKFQRKWKLELCPPESEETLHKTLDMDLQDPLEKQGLSMNSYYWDFIRNVFDKQLMAIQQKFGVEFVRVPDEGDEVTVKAVSAEDQTFSLALHAYKALEQLYQKGATDMLFCPLEKPAWQVEQIKRTFDKIRHRHPCVASGDDNGAWRLVGFAMHLGPAVEEVERELGEPVFNKKAKLWLRYPRSSPTVSEGATASQAGVPEEENCTICMDTFKNKKQLQCKHEFCAECLHRSVEATGPCCPLCKDVFGKMEGSQPEGVMRCLSVKSRLPGFNDCGTIEIEYNIPGGIQTKRHPNPGKRFFGTHRTAYLPDNAEGKEVLKLLQKAFDQKLIFTVGTSTTTGASDTVTWNDIHHKTSAHGGAESFGYPDPHYLRRVKEELKAKGIE